MSLKKILSIAVICVIFLLGMVLLALSGMYIFFTKNVFTTDIKMILIVTIAILMVFSIYVFSLKLISFAKDPSGRALIQSYRNAKAASKAAAKTKPAAKQFYSYSSFKEKPKDEPLQPQSPPAPSKPPVFVKKEESPPKKVYTPVFGPSSSDHNKKF